MLEACTHQIIAVTNDACINSDTVCALLTKMRCSITDGLPITIVLDNARYQHCRRVIAYAATLKIERRWRFVRQTALSTEYFDAFAAFKAAIQDYLDHSQTKYKTELATLLVLKFQTFKNIT